ncbi:hypothetical protein FRC14_001028 [Serendipita sp. 396]|nr:hypothetical protein FRC14_001028 [Serendipita sp. 396]
MPHTIAELEIGFSGTVLMEPSDTVGDRALSIQVVVDGDKTIEKCTAKCLAQGFLYASIEYSHYSVHLSTRQIVSTATAD